MNVIRISHPTGKLFGTLQLGGSKSLSNRVLLIKALCDTPFQIHSLSSSDDTTKLNELLSQSDREIYDVGHAGTSFRFLTAFLAIKEGTQILTGSSRMKERPIGPLVDALTQLSCNIEYLEMPNYPPLKIHAPKNLKTIGEIHIRADISSQYVTALLLIAPTLPNGLVIHLDGELVSESYLQMSINTLTHFGIEVKFEQNKITIAPQKYQAKDFTIEADWSAASYYYALTSMAKEADLSLLGLFKESVQGDAEIVDLGPKIGVETRFIDEVIKLTKRDASGAFEYNFINQPDIAQTMAVITAAKAIPARFGGLKTLKIKETDRINALNCELQKIGSGFVLDQRSPGTDEYYMPKPGVNFNGGVPRFASYKDHRMAMAFAPLALLSPIEIENPEVVSKSYPEFWSDLVKLGFVINPVH